MRDKERDKGSGRREEGRREEGVRKKVFDVLMTSRVFAPVIMRKMRKCEGDDGDVIDCLWTGRERGLLLLLVCPSS